MDLLDLDRRALASTRRFLAGTEVAQLGLPTPCAEWDVRALLDHVVRNNEVFAAGIRGQRAVGPRDVDRVADDPHAAYDRSADAVTAAFAAANLAADVDMHRLPGYQAVAVHFVDILTHGWDLAVATGQDPALDDDLASVALDVVAGYPPEVWGAGRFFADKVPAPDGAPPHVRLVTLLGRTL
jgi:uncharacterized protein (TIGR03086 family)